MRRFALFATALVALAACGDDDTRGSTGDTAGAGDGGSGGGTGGTVTIETPAPGDFVGHSASLSGSCPPGSIVHVVQPAEAHADAPCTGGSWSTPAPVDASALGPLDVAVAADHADGGHSSAHVRVVHAPTTFYLAPGGDDSVTGSLARPVATLGRARDLAAQSSGLVQQGVAVVLRGGSYALLDPVVFGPEHSGLPGATITFRAYPGETPILHGAIVFSQGHGGSFSETTVQSVSGPVVVKRFTFEEPMRSDLLARIAAIRASSNGGAFAITQAFIGGVRLVRSRHPNADTSVDARYVRLSDDGQGHPVCPTDGVAPASRQAYLMLPATDVDPVASVLADGHTELVFTDIWQEHRSIVLGENVATSTLRGVSTNLGLDEVTAACWAGYEDERGHFENNPLFVDSAHEWYLDEAAATFDFVPAPGDDTATATFALPVDDRLVVLAGKDAAHPVHDLDFEGIAVQYAAWRYGNSRGDANAAYHSFGQAEYGVGGAIDGNWVTRVRFGALALAHYGEHGIALGGSRGGTGRAGDGMASSVTIDGCTFTDGGAGSIRIDNRDSHAPTQATGNIVTGNVVDSMGRVFRDAAGMLVMATSGTKLDNNTIRNIPYSGVSLGWGCASTASDYNEIDTNDIRATMTFLRDGGGIYVTGSHGVAQANFVEVPGDARAADAPPFVLDFSLGMYNDDYSTWWQDLGNQTHKVTTKSATNRRAGNFYGSNPAELQPPDGQPPLGTGAEVNCPVRADGSAWQTPPTWWK